MSIRSWLASARHSGAVTISAPRRPGTPPIAPAWDTRPSRPRFQGLLCTIAALALLPAIATTIMRVFPPADDQTARLAAFIAYGLIGYLIALGCLLIVAGAGATPVRDRIDHHCRRPAYACATWRGWGRCLSMIIEPPVLRSSD